MHSKKRSSKTQQKSDGRAAASADRDIRSRKSTSYPGEKLVMDFSDFGAENVEPYHRYILLVVDHFTKFVWGTSFPTKHAAPVADWLYRTIYTTEFRPTTVLSDNGGEFVNEILSVVHDRMGVKETHGRPYRPQTQGQVERMNRTIKEKVRAFVDACDCMSFLDVHVCWFAEFSSCFRFCCSLFSVVVVSVVCLMCNLKYRCLIDQASVRDYPLYTL